MKNRDQRSLLIEAEGYILHNGFGAAPATVSIGLRTQMKTSAPARAKGKLMEYLQFFTHSSYASRFSCIHRLSHLQ